MEIFIEIGFPSLRVVLSLFLPFITLFTVASMPWEAIKLLFEYVINFPANLLNLPLCWPFLLDGYIFLFLCSVLSYIYDTQSKFVINYVAVDIEFCFKIIINYFCRYMRCSIQFFVSLHIPALHSKFPNNLSSMSGVLLISIHFSSIRFYNLFDFCIRVWNMNFSSMAIKNH